MQNCSFSLPLTAPQFAAALQRGQGRVMLHVKQFGAEGFQDAIIDACLFDRTYDPQCEWERTDWLMQLVYASRCEQQIVSEILPRLDERADRLWEVLQRCRVALALVRRGYTQARAPLYACLRQNTKSSDLIAAEEIIRLDGADGLIHVASHLGELLLTNTALVPPDGPLRWFDEQHGDGAAQRILDAIGPNSETVGEYLRRLAQTDAASSQGESGTGRGEAFMRIENVVFQPRAPVPAGTDPQLMSASAVIHCIETEEPDDNCHWYDNWGRKAPPESLLFVFEAMMHQQEPGRLSKFLRVFGNRSLPEFDARLLKFASHDDARVRDRANRALSNYAHPMVRSLGIDQLGRGLSADCQVQLLFKNYSPGDSAVISKCLRDAEDFYDLHKLVYDLVKLYRLNPEPDGTEAMHFAYEKSPCSNCREDAVKFLIRMGTAPQWLLDESIHDAIDRIRIRAAGDEPPP